VTAERGTRAVGVGTPGAVGRILGELQHADRRIDPGHAPDRGAPAFRLGAPDYRRPGAGGGARHRCLAERSAVAVLWAGSEALAGVAALAAGVQFPSTEALVVGTVRRIEQDDARSVGAQQVVGWSNSRPVGQTRRATPYETW
jgi:hypothetical protein